jgi:hypothetical protein
VLSGCFGEGGRDEFSSTLTSGSILSACCTHTVCPCAAVHLLNSQSRLPMHDYDPI